MRGVGRFLGVLGVLMGTLLGGTSAAEWRLQVETAPQAVAPRSAWMWLEPPGGAWPESSAVVYRWRCGEGFPAVETRRATRGCWYEQPGRYRPAVVIVEPDGRETTVMAAEPVAVAPRPPLRVDLHLQPANPRWRAPLAVSVSATVAGALDDEPLEELVWLLDEQPVARGAQARIRFDQAGEHRLAVVARTPWRRVVSSRVIAVQDNRPPACAIAQVPAEPPSPPLTARLTANCRDPDGQVVSYVWTVGGRSVGSGRSVDWTAPQAGAHRVRLRARDDAGGETEVETVVEWGK